MTAQEPYVIVGAGLAGAKAVESFDGRVVLIGEEAERLYDRPPLSKDYLQGKSEKEKIYVLPDGFYAEHDVELVLETRVTGIDRAVHRLIVHGGEPIRYDKLLLTTCRTSSPTSTTWGWSTGATSRPATTTGSCFERRWTKASTSRSGFAKTRCWPP